MHNFTPTDVGVFLLKLCKISHFFHFAQLYINWCNCSKIVWIYPNSLSLSLSLSLHKTWTELISTTYRVLVAKVVSAFCYLIVLVLWVLRMKVLWLFFKFWNSLVQSWCGWQLGIGNAISKLLMGIGWNDTLVLFFTRIR